VTTRKGRKMETYKFKLIGNTYAAKDKGVNIEPIQMNNELQTNDELLKIKGQQLKWAIIIALAVAIAFLVALLLILNLI
jgi:flagellar biosynthesis/type III secretory pathway M-ring protein FliF/YscJ